MFPYSNFYTGQFIYYELSLLNPGGDLWTHFKLSPVGGTPNVEARRGRCPHRPQAARQCGNLKCPPDLFHTNQTNLKPIQITSINYFYHSF